MKISVLALLATGYVNLTARSSDVRFIRWSTWKEANIFQRRVFTTLG